MTGFQRRKRDMGKIALALVTATVAIAAPLATYSQPVAAQSLSGGEIAEFYRSRGGAPLWLAPNAGPAAQQLIQLLATAQADHLNPKRYNVRALQRALADGQRGSGAAVQRAEAMLSAAFVTYARDLKHDPGVGIIYVDKELKPTPPSALELLSSASRASSLSNYVQQMGWMNPIYAKLRQALASRLYRNLAELRLLSL